LLAAPQFDVPTDRLIGIQMDLVDVDQYARPPHGMFCSAAKDFTRRITDSVFSVWSFRSAVKRGELAPADAALFADAAAGSGSGSGSAGSGGHSGLSRSGITSAPKLEQLLQGHTFSWLRRVEVSPALR
jgi:hypothetical protein